MRLNLGLSHATLATARAVKLEVIRRRTGEVVSTRDVPATTEALRAFLPSRNVAPLADQPQQAATGVVILLVRLEVLGEVVDALGHQRDLDLGRPCIAFVGRELRDDRLLGFRCKAH